MATKNTASETLLVNIDDVQENFVQKSLDFHKNCVKELQDKLKYLESRFNILNVMLKSRNLTEDDLKSVSLQELIEKNREINEEDFTINCQDKNNVQILTKMEEYLDEKKKVFEFKKQFMEHIQTIKEDYKGQLSGLFDELNQVEDEYTISERTIEDLQTAIELNQSELERLKEKMGYLQVEKNHLEETSSALGLEVNAHNKTVGRLEAEVEELKSRNTEKHNTIHNQLKHINSLHANILQNKLDFYENREKAIYLNDLHEEVNKENEKLNETKS